MFTKYFSTYSLLCLCRKKIDNVYNENSTGIFFSLLIMLRMGIPWMNFFNETTVYGLTILKNWPLNKWRWFHSSQYYFNMYNMWCTYIKLLIKPQYMYQITSRFPLLEKWDPSRPEWCSPRPWFYWGQNLWSLSHHWPTHSPGECSLWKDIAFKINILLL